MPGTRYIIFLVILLMIVWVGCTKEDAGKMPISTKSNEAKEHFFKGRDLFEKLRGQESLEHFKQAIEKDPEFSIAYFYYAQAQPTAKGFFEQIDKALMHIDKASDAESNLILGLQAAVNGNPLGQREYYQKVVSLYPKDERAHFFLAGNYFGQQEYEKAISEYNEAAKINPEFSPTYNQLGYANRFLEKFDDAEIAFKKYIELIKDDPNPYDSYAELLMKIGRYEESIEQYKAALALNPNFVASHVGISTNLNYLGKHAQARVQCQKLFDMARDDGEKRTALTTMAVSYVDEGKMEKALEKLNDRFNLAKKIDDSANMAADMNLIGLVNCEMGNCEEALQNYDLSYKTIQESGLSDQVIENGRMTYLNNQAVVALNRNDFKTARSKANEYMEAAKAKNNPTQMRVYFGTMGRIAMGEKKYEEAIENFKKANQQNPYHLYRMAICFKEMGDIENAKVYCEKAANYNALNSLNYSFCRTSAKEMLAGF